MVDARASIPQRLCGARSTESSSHICEERQANGNAEGTLTSRWGACLHEAAHLVAACVLLKKSATAMVFSDGSGVAEVGGGVPASFQEAMVAAAGIMGDVLVLQYPPPKNIAITLAEIAAPEPAQRAKAARGKIMSDRMAVAQWCIADHESKPESWAERHEWVFSSAESFVQEHRQEVIAVATELFIRGVITLPAEPEEGTEHAN